MDKKQRKRINEKFAKAGGSALHLDDDSFFLKEGRKNKHA
jgi:hypothetical protein